MVLAAVAEFEFVGFGAGGTSHELISQTDAECRYALGKGFFYYGNGFIHDRGIAWAVGEEESVACDFVRDEVVVPWYADDVAASLEK